MISSPAIEMSRMQVSAGQACDMLRALSNENRLLLLCQLCKGERSVGELEKLLHIRQPTLSQQLGILRNDDLVHTRRNGKQIFYRIADERVVQLIEALCNIFTPPTTAPTLTPTPQ